MQDFGKLLLRLAVGGLMLFHGINKVANFEATNKFIIDLLEKKDLPAFLSYGVLIGELVAPALILVGLFTRLGGLAIAATMVMAVYLSHQHELVGPEGTFPVLKDGGWALELQAFYFLGGLALACLGSGKIAVASGESD